MLTAISSNVIIILLFISSHKLLFELVNNVDYFSINCEDFNEVLLSRPRYPRIFENMEKLIFKNSNISGNELFFIINEEN